MSLRTLGFVFLIISTSVFAQGRKPAVEDFVGIEIEQPERNPQGTESLFNFEKDIDKFEMRKDDDQASKIVIKKIETPTDYTSIFGFVFLLGLPALIWLFMVKNLKQKAHIESASNIAVLEKYRREKQEAKKADDKVNKAS